MIRISHPKTKLLMATKLFRHLVLDELIEYMVARCAAQEKPIQQLMWIVSTIRTFGSCPKNH